MTQEVIPADLAAYFELLDRQQMLFKAADSIMATPCVPGSGAIILAGLNENFKQRDQVLADCDVVCSRLVDQGWTKHDLYTRAMRYVAEKWGKR